MDNASTIPDFVALCVHSSELGLVYVKNGEIHDKAKLYGNKQDLEDVQSYFDKVEYVLAFNIGIHRANLKNMFEGIGSCLPEKKYVCVYNWAKVNIGTTTFETVCEILGIQPRPMNGGYNNNGWDLRDYVYNAELLAEAAIMLHESCGMELDLSVSGDRASSRLKFWKDSFTGIQKTAIETKPADNLAYFPDQITKEIFVNQKVVVTGDFYTFPDRELLVKKLVSLGAVKQSTVNSKTNIVVVGSEPGPSKIKLLQDLLNSGSVIKVLNERQIATIVE